VDVGKSPVADDVSDERLVAGAGSSSSSSSSSSRQPRPSPMEEDDDDKSHVAEGVYLFFERNIGRMRGGAKRRTAGRGLREGVEMEAWMLWFR